MSDGLRPIVYSTTHRIMFSDLDPYAHLNTGRYATYYADHRIEGLRAALGWDLQTLSTLPFMIWVRRIEIDFLRPVRGNEEITITSFVREFRGSDAVVDCTLLDSAGTQASRCVMTVAYVDKATNRAGGWPADIRELFFEGGTASTPTPGRSAGGGRTDPALVAPGSSAPGSGKYPQAPPRAQQG